MITANITSIKAAFLIAIFAVAPRILPEYGENDAPRLEPTRTIDVKNGALIRLNFSLIVLKIYGIIKELEIPINTQII